MRGNLAKRAGHQLHVDAATVQLGQQFQQLAIAHQRISAYQRQVQRAMLFDHAKNALHQGAALAVGELPQGDARRAQVRVFIGVTSRTTQRDIRV